MKETAISTPLVSIIIPVRNTAHYLRQCMDSVIGQSLQNIEIICIDDASTDGSSEILREYAQKDHRIKLLSRTIPSVGAARNDGIAVAEGKYIVFWDSDDWFELGALDCMYKLCVEREADLCICNAQDFDDTTGYLIDHNYTRKPYPETETFNVQDCKSRIFGFTSTVCWNKMFQRQLLIDNNIRFPENMVFEDGVVSMLALRLADRITVCAKKLIHYRVNRTHSIMMNNANRADKIITGCKEYYRQLSSRNLLNDEMILRSFLDKVAGLYLFTIPLRGDYEEYKKYYNQIFLTEDSLLQMWDSSWEMMPDMEKYLEAKKLSPDEYLFQILKKSKLLTLKQGEQIRKLEKEKKQLLTEEKKLQKKLATIMNSRSFRFSRVIATIVQKIKNFFTLKAI